MHCDACVALIEEALGERARGGARRRSTSTPPRRLVGYDPSVVGVDELRATIEEAGYSATPVG